MNTNSEDWLFGSLFGSPGLQEDSKRRSGSTVQALLSLVVLDRALVVLA